jgi:chemotaxis protein MotB
LKVQILDKAEKVSFSSGSAQLAPDAQSILTEIAKAICQLPNPITIGGHTDRAVFPEGSTYTNWELSADRANAARRAIEAGCVKPEQIRRIIGFADTDLMVPEDPYSPSNRRISITVLRLNDTATTDEDEKAQGSDEEQIKEQSKENSLPKTSTAENIPNANQKTKEKLPQKNVNDEEAQQQKTKLAKEGSVVVGEPDPIPQKVRKTREPISSRKESEEN